MEQMMAAFKQPRRAAHPKFGFTNKNSDDYWNPDIPYSSAVHGPVKNASNPLGLTYEARAAWSLKRRRMFMGARDVWERMGPCVKDARAALIFRDFKAYFEEETLMLGAIISVNALGDRLGAPALWHFRCIYQPDTLDRDGLRRI